MDAESSSSDEETAFASPAAEGASKSLLQGTVIEAVPGLRLVYDVMSEEEEDEALAGFLNHRGVPANNIRAHNTTVVSWRCPPTMS
jgi:hypothetical protein